MKKQVHAWIGLGANLGDAVLTLSSAVKALGNLPDTCLLQLSSLYRSAPIDAQGPDFFNAVACYRTQLSELALLEAMQSIELQFGRQRPYYHAPRTLDLDLLLYDNVRLQTPTLTLPHPAMHLRRFVLEPMAELNDALVIPSHGTVRVLLSALPQQAVERVHSKHWLTKLPN